MSQRTPHEEGLSLTEWAVLGVLGESPAHPFAIARQLAADGDMGRILTVRRPLVYRALDRLVAMRLAEPVRTEPGRAGPRRTVHHITAEGRRSLRRWLREPVGHVRDLRLEFLVKVELVRRSGGSFAALVRAQSAALDDTLEALASTAAGSDVAALWRRHQALAAKAFLEELAARASAPGS